MKKIFIVFAILFSFIFSVSVYAHQGKTDGNGGHIDHSTGEYHYHHGYSAHQHKDLDGDGDVDCPYKFVDKTNHNSKKSVSYFENKSTNSKGDSDWIAFVLGALALIFIYFVLPLMINLRR